LGSLRKKISTKFRNRYRIILRQDENLEEKVSFVLTPLNVVLAICVGLFVFGTVIYLMLAYTPLNHIFPTKSAKYSNMQQFEMLQRIDSLEISLSQLKFQSDMLNKILEGEDVEIADDVNTRSEAPAASPVISNSFFTPLKGVISDTFNIDRKHYAIDIAAKSKEVIKSVQKGTVVFSAWTAVSGHTLIIQHPNDFVSVYKHNAALIKKEGAFVNAGDAVALVGNTGELTTGPHLHFELWSKGLPVNPQEYINF
jgi:murein DD-endopeptidase MepM/ murein hydrolase activator NlpD